MIKRLFEAAGRQDIYTRVTDMVIADLERGVRPWTKPWDAGNTEGRIMRPLRHNGEPYGGINVLMLWGAAMENGYSSPTWMTFKQAQALGGHVRKGERASPVVYASTFRKAEHTDSGDIEKDIRFLKIYSVFNVQQIENLPEQFYDKPPPASNPLERNEEAERFFAATGADIREGGYQAYYSPGHDYIRMPPLICFKDPASYYSTLAHELTHWTKHPSRLDRDFGRKKLGDEGYAQEELVAELGAAFLAADLNLTPAVREDHAAYIEHWLQALKNDKRFIFAAASHAQRAANFIHGLQPAIHRPELEEEVAPAADAAPEPGAAPQADAPVMDIFEGDIETLEPVDLILPMATTPEDGETRYTVEVSFTADGSADEHLHSESAIEGEVQSWLEGLGASVENVKVRQGSGTPPVPAVEGQRAGGEPHRNRRQGRPRGQSARKLRFFPPRGQGSPRP